MFGVGVMDLGRFLVFLVMSVEVFGCGDQVWRVHDEGMITSLEYLIGVEMSCMSRDEAEGVEF